MTSDGEHPGAQEAAPTPSAPGAPVGEATEDYRLWARTWARFERDQKVRPLLAVALLVSVAVIGSVSVPSGSMHARLGDVDALTRDVGACCHSRFGWSGTCEDRVTHYAKHFDARSGAVAAFMRDKLEPLIPLAVPSDPDLAVRQELWRRCPEAAVIVEAHAYSFDDPRTCPTLERTMRDPDPDIAAAAVAVLRRARVTTRPPCAGVKLPP